MVFKTREYNALIVCFKFLELYFNERCVPFYFVSPDMKSSNTIESRARSPDQTSLGELRIIDQ